MTTILLTSEQTQQNQSNELSSSIRALHRIWINLQTTQLFNSMMTMVKRHTSVAESNSAVDTNDDYYIDN